MTRPVAPVRSIATDRLTAALDEVGGFVRPDYLDHIVTQASRTRQRPAWTFLERWLPMTIALRPAAVPRAYLTFMVLLAALLALLLASLLFAGSPSLPAAHGVVNGLIAFDAGGDIDVVQPDGTGQRTLIGSIVDEHTPVWSPDGSRLAFWARTTVQLAWDLVVVDSDGTSPVTVAVGALESTGDVSWSPNGSAIAYSARTPATGACPGSGYYNGDFCTSRIFIAAADGSGSRQVGDPALDARSPAWSPDGSTIAFGGGNASQEVHLYRMDAGGTNVRQLSDVRGTDWAFIRQSWSHDGTTIAGQASAADDMAEWDIWTIEADGSGAIDVGAHVGGDEIIPRFAPDRDALVWLWTDQIVLREDGAGPVDVPLKIGVPTWSPDGQLLAAAGSDTLRVIDAAGDVRATISGATGDLSWQALRAP